MKASRQTFLVLEATTTKIDDLDGAFSRVSQQDILQGMRATPRNAPTMRTSGFKSQWTIRW